MHQNALHPPHELATEELLLWLQADLELYRSIKNAHYLSACTSIPKAGTLHLAWEYAKDPAHHSLFQQLLCISPHSVAVLFELIKDHPVFQNDSCVPQLAVTLYRMGRYGNAASLADVAHTAGCGEGSVDSWRSYPFSEHEIDELISATPL